MEIRVKIKEVLTAEYGGFITYLEKEYETKLIRKLVSGDIDKQKAWLTYNQVVLEIKHNIKDSIKVKELQYNLTDNLNPNEVCVDVIDSIVTKTQELIRLSEKIKNL